MKKQLLTIAALAFGAVLVASRAEAGEGGIAAAAAFHIDPSSGKITDIAVAAGIGKTSAVAGAQLDYSSVLTSTYSTNSFNASGSSTASGSGGCYYYFYCSPGPSSSSSTNSSESQSASSATYQPVTSVKAFAVGSAGSLSYSPSYGYYYYGGSPSIYIGGEDPASVGTAQANQFNHYNINATNSGISF